MFTEEMLKSAAREANLDQLSLVLFHECRHQPESSKGIARIREAIASLLDSTSRQVAESLHDQSEREKDALKNLLEERLTHAEKTHSEHSVCICTSVLKHAIHSFDLKRKELAEGRKV